MIWTKIVCWIGVPKESYRYRSLKIYILELDANQEVVEWGDCLPDCPTQITNPVCLMDPVPPALQDGYQGSKNYTTDFDFGVGTVTKGVII